MAGHGSCDSHMLLGAAVAMVLMVVAATPTSVVGFHSRIVVVLSPTDLAAMRSRPSGVCWTSKGAPVASRDIVAAVLLTSGIVQLICVMTSVFPGAPGANT